MSGLKICVDQGEGEKWLTPLELETLTGVKFISGLKMENETILRKVERLAKPSSSLLKKCWKRLRSLFDPPQEEIEREQRFRGRYYQKEIELGSPADLILRWIGPPLGWGVFAARAFRPREFIAEYTGVVRKWQKADRKNGYCFEYVVTSGKPTPYVIDAREEAGLARYINHSEEGNLEPKLATLDSITHVILLTKRAVAKGEQLSYHYGPAYWAKRPPPISL